MKHWKQILVLVPLVIFLLSFWVKGTEGTKIVHYQFAFPGNPGYRFTIKLPNTPLGETVPNPPTSYVVPRPYKVKGHYNYWFSNNAPWSGALDHPYFILDVNGGQKFTYYYPDSIAQNNYPGSEKWGEGSFEIPPNQSATICYNAGYYVSRFFGFLWITGEWGVAGSCTIELYLDDQGPLAPNLQLTSPQVINNWYYTAGTVNLTWNTPSDLPGKVSGETSGVQGYKIYEIFDGVEKEITPGGKYITENSLSLNLSGDGLHTIKIIAFDNENNPGEPSTIDMMVDQTPPALSASDIQIDDNSGYTNASDAKVKLDINYLRDNDNGCGLDQVRVSNDGVNYTGYSCDPIKTKRTISDWELVSPTVDGTKTVYLKLKDKLGNETTAITKTITLDRTPPDGSILINFGANTTYDQDVTLTLSATDTLSGVTKMMFCNDSNVIANYSAETDFKREYIWTLSDNNESGTNKTKTVYVIFKDGAGNQSSVEIKDSIVYEDDPSFTDSTPVTTLQDEVTTWSTDQDIIGQVIVPIGKQLIILPGVTVTFNSPAGKNCDPELNGLIIQGTLVVQNGTTGVTFTKAAEQSIWMGIIVSGTAILDGANISWAKRGVAVLSDAIGVSVSGCAFSRNFIGVHAYGSAPEITDCTFQSNTYGIKEDDGGAPVVAGCVYTGNAIDYYDEVYTKLEHD